MVQLAATEGVDPTAFAVLVGIGVLAMTAGVLTFRGVGAKFPESHRLGRPAVAVAGGATMVAVALARAAAALDLAALSAVLWLVVLSSAGVTLWFLAGRPPRWARPPWHRQEDPEGPTARGGSK